MAETVAGAEWFVGLGYLSSLTYICKFLIAAEEKNSSRLPV